MSTSVNLPGGIILGSDESVVRTDQYRLSLMSFFLKTKVALTNKRLAGEEPNTALGLIPIGSKKVSFPLANVASIGISTSFRIWRFLLGLLLIVLGLSLVGESPAMLIIAVLGIPFIFGAFQTAFEITNNAGQTIALRIDILQKRSAQTLVNEVNRVIAELS